MKKLKKLLLGAIATLTLASCDLSGMMGGGFSLPDFGNLGGSSGITNNGQHESLGDLLEGDLEEKMFNSFLDFSRQYGDFYTLYDWLLKGESFVKMYVESIDRDNDEIVITFKDGTTKTVHNWSLYHVRQWPNCAYGGEAILECATCGELKKLLTPPSGFHEVNPYRMDIEPTCTRSGTEAWRCAYCDYEEHREVPAYGHEWNYDNVPCGFTGTIYTNCWRCGINTEISIDVPTEHKEWYGNGWTGGSFNGEGWTFADSEEMYCPYDNTKRVRWSIDQVTPQCEQWREISFYSEGKGGYESIVEPNCRMRNGMEFYGRPIGNAVELDGDGNSVKRVDRPSPNIEGSFIEYKIRTTRSMRNVKLKSFIMPDQNNNVTDIWKSLGDMRGYDFDSIEAASSGKGYQTINDFNIMLYIDGVKIEFDRNINTPVRHDTRYGMFGENWYTFPMDAINLSAGSHTIKLVQAAGIRHSFHEFVLEEEYDESTIIDSTHQPVVLNEVFFEEGTGFDAGKAFVYIGGELRVSEEIFLAYEPYFNLQVNGNSNCIGCQIGNPGSARAWSNFRLDNTPGIVSCVIRNGKGYLKADLTSIQYGGFNTHLNFIEKQSADCRMNRMINTTQTPVVIGTSQYSAIADPNASASDGNKYWGNLAIIVAPAGSSTGSQGGEYYEAGEPLGGHIISADNVYGTSGGRKIVCNHCAGLQGYEFKAQDALRGQTNPSETGTDSVAKNTRLGKNNIFEDVWSIQDLDRGTYQVYLKARCSMGNSNAGYWYSPASIEQGDSLTNNGTTEEAQTSYKYKIAVTNGDSNTNSNWTGIGNEIDSYANTGINEYTPEWTNKVMATVTFREGDNTLTLRNTGSGYTIWVYSLCLVKIA